MTELSYVTGFGGHFESEAIAGALPRAQNSPRRAPLGLYAEQINGTPFTAPRAKNRRSWVYRIRPTVVDAPWKRVASRAGLSLDHLERPVEPNLLGWRPLPLDELGDHDFVDGLRTICGAGDPSMGAGVAVHLFTATRSMERRAFASHDGDLLLAPDTGMLRLRTELGVLDVAPGEIAVVPRGIRFAVDLSEAPARGYAFEPYGRAFELPERGVIGANGLADPRHFEHPVAAFEDSDEPHRVTAKIGGVLYDTTRPGSPLDVVAWHGNLVPYRFDLARFVPVGATRVDHPDPSIYTVLTAPLDRPGESAADFVVFPERWEVTEDTFRPPFYHRNATSEVNGIVRGPTADRVFSRGGCFLTPALAGHGVEAETYERHIAADDADADTPERMGVGSTWIQLETIYSLRVAPWALDAPGLDRDFAARVRTARRHFTG